MKKKIINGLLFAVAMVAATSSFVSCKDYEGDNYAEFQEKYATLQEAYNAQVKAMKDYVLTSRYNDETGYSAAELAAKGTIKKRLDDLEKDTASLAARIQKNNEAIASLGDTLKHFVFMWGDNLTDAYANAGKAKQIALSYDTDTAAVNRAIEHAQEIADKAWEYVNKGQAVDKNGKTKEDFQAWVKYFEAADKELADEIDELNKSIDNLLATFKMDITGIVIQGTENPIYGTFAYPFDSKSKVLAAYYGKADAGYTFPTTEDDKWLLGQSVLSAEELAAMAASKAIKPYDLKRGVICDDTEGNAGTLYLTINPSNVVLVGKDFTLRTTGGNVSKVTLSDLQPSTKDLEFGYKRAGAAENSRSGFYSAKATIAKEDFEDLKLGLNFDFKSLNNAIGDMFTNWGSTHPATGLSVVLESVSQTISQSVI